MSNTMFDNTLFIAGTIPAMENSWDRLVEVAALPPDADERGVVSQLVAHMGTLVGDNPQQTITNWRTRKTGVSMAGALAAQKAYRCDANWLLTGEGAKNLTWPFSAELLGVVGSLSTDGLVKLEGVMRAHLGMAPISIQSLHDLSTHLETDQSVARTTPTSATKSRPNLERSFLKENSEHREVGEVQKQGAGRGRKGTARRG